MVTTTDPENRALPADGDGWTGREIRQQPRLWRDVAAAVTARRSATEAFLRPVLTRPGLRILLTGAGTSAFAGEILAPGLTRDLRRRVDAVATTDLVSNPREYFAEDLPTLLVSFARSGDSPESVAATRLADECLSECHHLVITCNSRGALHLAHAGSPRSLVLAMPPESNDRGFAMTSSFTCMVLTALLTLRRSAPDKVVVERLAAAAEQVLATRVAVARQLAGRGHRRIVYLGSGALKGLARESALKVMELTAGEVATWFDSPLGFRHGPKSVLDPGTLVVVYVSTDPYTRAYDLDMVRELRGSAKGGVLVVTTTPVGDAADAPADGTWLVPVGAVGDGAVGAVGDAEVSLVFVLCAQLLALSLSTALGRTPDNPFVSGEVNRVVQGVTVHPLHRSHPPDGSHLPDGSDHVESSR